jgi:transitional endoplasmic reticulum ATPase
MAEPDKQIAALRAALAVSPDNIPLRLHLAETLREAGQTQPAIEEYQVILQQDAQCAPAEQALGALFYEAGNFNAALPHLRRAVELTPKDARALLTLAQVEMKLGDQAEAFIHLGAARALDPALAKEIDPMALTPDGPDDRATATADGSEVVLPERPTQTFADIGGLEAVKEQIRLKIIYPFQRPELYAAYGKKAGGGILLYGPLGCGKTLLARATAGEVQAHFIHVGINDVLGVFHGETQHKLHAIFELARRKAPAVLFFDEVDAIGGKRIDMRESFLRAEVNQFLAEMDGMGGSNEQLLIMGATNAPWHVDQALMRPGRFDRVIFVPPPDLDARLAILQVHLQGKPVTKVDLPRLARQTEGYSGADIMGIIETATEAALQETMHTSKIRPLTTDSLLNALRETRLSMEDWLNTAHDYATYANAAGFYDEVLAYLKKRKRR